MSRRASLPIPHCGDCRHFVPQAVDPLNLGAPKQGQCREGPPAATVIGVHPQQGPILFHTYPQLPATFEACHRFDACEVNGQVNLLPGG